ncbi:hypothetical protein [uncultured Sphaerochaeta sp.]|uniref:hypothetical protein n=1 Tax=uncultured Sphaerochaeta sp. TaxID=886478 RepID=UPI0029CA3ECF|nr:hypothetical protein [uncultured Sphaerochaeta sp.]
MQQNSSTHTMRCACEASSSSAEKSYQDLLERSTLQQGLLEAIAHDLRSPLVSISAMRELFASGVAEKSPELWERSEAELDFVFEWFDTLLGNIAVLHLEEATYPLNVIDASSVIQSAPAYLERYAEARSITFYTSIDENALVRANEHLLAQVLKCIWECLLKGAAPEGNIVTKLFIEPSYAHYQITCDSLCIPRNVIDQLHRGDLFPSSQRFYFYLSLARKIVYYQRGSLSVEEGDGGTLMISILIPRFLSEERSVPCL